MNNNAIEVRFCRNVRFLYLRYFHVHSRTDWSVFCQHFVTREGIFTGLKETMLQYPPDESRSQCRSTVCKTLLYSLSHSFVSVLYQEITNLHLHGDSDSPCCQKLVFWQPKFSLFIISFHYLLKSVMMYYSLQILTVSGSAS